MLGEVESAALQHLIKNPFSRADQAPNKLYAELFIRILPI